MLRGEGEHVKWRGEQGGDQKLNVLSEHTFGIILKPFSLKLRYIC